MASGPCAVGQVLVDDGSAACRSSPGRGLRRSAARTARRTRMASLRRGHQLQLALGRDEHDPGGGGVEDLDAAVGQHREQVDDVEVVDQGVGQLDHRPGEHRFSGHGGPPEVGEDTRSNRSLAAWYVRGARVGAVMPIAGCGAVSSGRRGRRGGGAVPHVDGSAKRISVHTNLPRGAPEQPQSSVSARTKSSPNRPSGCWAPMASGTGDRSCTSWRNRPSSIPANTGPRSRRGRRRWTPLVDDQRGLLHELGGTRRLEQPPAERATGDPWRQEGRFESSEREGRRRGERTVAGRRRSALLAPQAAHLACIHPSTAVAPLREVAEVWSNATSTTSGGWATDSTERGHRMTMLRGHAGGDATDPGRATMYEPASNDEITGLVNYLDEQLTAIRAAAIGLTDEQARMRPCRSALSIGGLIKHATYVMRGATARLAGERARRRRRTTRRPSPRTSRASRLATTRRRPARSPSSTPPASPTSPR